MNRLAVGVLALGLLGASGAAHANLGEVTMRLSGALNHELSHRFEARSDVRNRIGASCMGPWPSLMLTLDAADHPVGVKLNLRLPSKPEVGNYALSIAGQNGSVRSSLQIIRNGQTQTALLERGELALTAVGENYAGRMSARFKISGEAEALELVGSLRTSLVVGSCHP